MISKRKKCLSKIKKLSEKVLVQLLGIRSCTRTFFTIGNYLKVFNIKNKNIDEIIME